MAVDRKAFLRLAAGSLAAFVTGKRTGAFSSPGNSQVPSDGGALSAARWAMVVDARKCLKEEGCDLCIKACGKSHNLPEMREPRHAIRWIWKEPFRAVFFSEQSTGYANAALADRPFVVLCNHCDRPPCVRVCPTKATWKREDGIVMMDSHRCIGCRYCMAACPYGARSFNWSDPHPFIKALNPDYPARSKGVVEKCTFCAERLARGEAPACVAACTSKALIIGDLEDPSSPARQALEAGFTIRRKPELGTVPKVYYLI